MTTIVRGRKPNAANIMSGVSYLLCFMCLTLLNEYCITAFIFCSLSIRDLSDGSLSVTYLMESKASCMEMALQFGCKGNLIKVDWKLSL